MSDSVTNGRGGDEETAQAFNICVAKRILTEAGAGEQTCNVPVVVRGIVARRCQNVHLNEVVLQSL